MAKKAKVPSLKVGDWVKVLKVHDENAKKGMIGVVCRLGSSPRVTFMSNTGDSFGWWIPEEKIEKIKAPQFVVTWSYEDTDPLRHFETLAEARAFYKKINGKRFDGSKVIEAAIYKVTK